jgi:hypothetical protein
MRIGSFEVVQPLPELNEPHVIAILRPWLDAGSAGTMIFQRLETRFEAHELAKLARPGTFYDFTRYRPLTLYQGSIRQLSIPNTTLTFSHGETGHDFIFLHLLEPHAFGEAYAASVWELLKKLKITRYCLVGSFYDLVPHTRPTPLSGGSTRPDVRAELQRMGVRQSHYEGPTTICNLINEEAEKSGVEVLTVLAHIPEYTELEEDYIGMMAIMKVLYPLYNIPVSDSDIQATDAQIRNLDSAISQSRKLKSLVARLEYEYDTRASLNPETGETNLSPEVDQFLKEMENRFKDN